MVHTIQFFERTSELSEQSVKQDEEVYLLQEQADCTTNHTNENEKWRYSSFPHTNFSLDKLTFYYTSRLRA